MPLAKLGIGSYAFRWSIGHRDRVPVAPMCASDVVDAAAALELPLVQFADNLPLHALPDDELDALGTHAHECGVTLEIGLQGSDMVLLGEYLAIATRLESPLVRLALDAPDAAIDQEVLVARFAAAARDAEARGVVLGIENHFGFPSTRLAALVESVGSRHLGVCLDVANSICGGEWPSETIERLAPHAVNLHLKDYEILPDPYGVGFRIQGVPLGQGRSDIGWTLAQVERSGRDVNVVLEHWLPWDDDAAALVAREHDWLSKSVAVARARLSER